MADFFQFLQFWWHCILKGWEIGDGLINVIGTLALLISGCLQWRKRHKHRQKWEDFAIMVSVIVFLLAFLISTIFVAPFLQEKEVQQEKDIALVIANNWSNKWEQLTDKKEKEKQEDQEAAKRREDRRLAALEADAKRQNKILFGMVSNSDPIRGAISALAQPVPPLKFSDGKIIDFDSAVSELESVRQQQEAQLALAQLDQKNLLNESADVFDSIASRWLSVCSDLAKKGGYTMANTYRGIPKAGWETNYAEIKMGGNENWNCTMSFSFDSGSPHVMKIAWNKPKNTQFTAETHSHGSHIESVDYLIRDSKMEISKKSYLLQNYYGTNLDYFLGLFIAAQKEHCSIIDTK